MKFEDLDPVLVSWTRANGLFLGNEFKDVPVRTWLVVDKKGNEYQMWLEIKNNDISVHAWDRRNRRMAISTDTKNLKLVLSKVLDEVEMWMGENKPSRI